MTHPLVSIVVPCFNQAHFLDESLQSVLEQSYSYWECTIVNDGSPDQTSVIAKKWIDKDSRFKYLEKENGGLSSARNAGIATCSGDYILPLDADDILHRDYLTRMLPLLMQDQSLCIVSCNTYFFTNTIKKTLYELQPKGSELKHILYQNQLVATSLYAKSSWEKVGGYDEQMKTGFEDWEFWLRVLQNEKKSYFILPEALFYYRKAKTSMLVNTVAHHFETTKEYIIKKHPELYKSDFHNFVSVSFHNLRTSREREKKLINSLEYRVGKMFLKPFKMFRNSFTNKNHE